MKKTFDNRGLAKRTVREIKLIKYFKHKNILPLLGFVLPRNREDFDHIYQILPLEQSDLYTFLKSPVEYGLNEIKYLCFQMLEGMHFLHSMGVIHRDIKPRNILISEKVSYYL